MKYAFTLLVLTGAVFAAPVAESQEYAIRSVLNDYAIRGTKPCAIRSKAKDYAIRSENDYAIRSKNDYALRAEKKEALFMIYITFSRTPPCTCHLHPHPLPAPLADPLSNGEP